MPGSVTGGRGSRPPNCGVGRHREIGPQVTPYCPAPLLRAGGNAVTVLEVERLGGEQELQEHPELGPPQECVEECDRPE